MKQLFAALVLTGLAGCITTAAQVQGAAPDAQPDTPQETYFEIEQRLLDAKILRVDFQINATGAFSVAMSGDLVAQKPKLAAIAAQGYFAGNPVVIKLAANQKRMRASIGAQGFEQASPQDLHGGLIVGLMRMGVLHNLAMLSAGAPPDATDGSVKSWVVPDNFTKLAGNSDGLAGIGFDLQVNSTAAGSVQLWYNPATGLPVRRDQTVHFADGDMTVSEQYNVRIDGIIGPCRFNPDTLTYK